jgi:hypothetical protein
VCFGTFAIYKQSHRHASLFSVKQSIFVSVSPEMLKAPQDPPPMLANMTNRSQSATHLPKNLFKQNTNHLFGTVPLSAGSIRSAETRLIKKKKAGSASGDGVDVHFPEFPKGETHSIRRRR